MDLDGYLEDADPAQLRALIDSDSDDSFQDDLYGDDLRDDDYALSANEDEEDDDDYFPRNDREDATFFDDEGFEEEPYIDNDEDDEQNFYNALREVNNIKPKKKKGGLKALRSKMRREHEPTPEVKQLLSKANEDFVANRLDDAAQIYLEVIKLDSRHFGSYKTLGEIYQMQGELNKCSNMWFLAAHLHPWDHQFWRTLAELSLQLGHSRQAMYCYSKAISSSKGKDYASVFDRAILYRNRGQYKRAFDSLQKLRKILPRESRIVREISLVYVEQNRINDAITMYNKILEDNIAHRKLFEKDPSIKFRGIEFTWSELNILSELYGKKAVWDVGSKLIKNISRWIQHRESQTFWSDATNDAEFDERRKENPKYQNLSAEEQQKEYTLPIDIRVQLGTFRLNSKTIEKPIEKALIHYDFLLEENIEETADLYFTVGNELERHGLYSEALKFLCPLSYVDSYSTEELMLSIAACCRETKDFESAKEAYEKLLLVNPNNLDYRANLAETYIYLGEYDIADKLNEETEKMMAKGSRESARKNLAGVKRTAEDDVDMAIDEDHLLDESDDNVAVDDDFYEEHEAMISELPRKGRKKAVKEHVSDKDLHLMETRSITRVQEKFAKADRLFEGIENGSQFATNAWIDVVAELIEIFSTYKAFFSSDRAKKLNTGLRKRTAKLTASAQLSRMEYLRDELRLTKAVDTNRIKLTSDDGTFKSVSFTKWFDLFMRYALVTSDFENNADDALVIQEIVKNVNVFQNDPTKSLVCSLVCISAALKTDAHALAMTQLRNLMNEHQFSIPLLKTFLASSLPRIGQYGHYSDAPNQKYILRQVKAFDSLRIGKDIVNMASISNNVVDNTKTHPVLDYIYCSFLFDNRSYSSALSYALRCYSYYKKDPSITFLVGLCYLHRSVQRLTINKNFQVIQAFTYLLEYVDLILENGTIYEVMEANYNIGRAFHQLNLLTLAIPFYERVLETDEDEIVDKASDLRLDAAYNMFLIYNYNGNPRLANDILNRYLVI